MSNQHILNTLSEITLPNGHVTYKLDYLGSIRIYGKYYFNVWRRYNNVYEIVIEDFSGDFHYHKDYTIRESIQKILCLSNEQMEGIYTIEAISFKHHADVSEEVTSMRWTEMEHRWYAMDLNVGGILHKFHSIQPFQYEDTMPVLNVEELSLDLTQGQQWQPPQQEETRQGVSTPQNGLSKKSLSDRFSEVPPRTSTPLCSEEDFIVLRNGTRIPKINSEGTATRSTHVYCCECGSGTPTCDECVDRESEYAQKGYVSNPPSR